MDSRGLGEDMGSKRSAPQRQQSQLSVDEMYDDCSPFDSQDNLVHGLVRNLDVNTATSLIVQAYAERVASAATKKQGLTFQESEDSDSEDEEAAKVPPPKGFKGKLVRGESSTRDSPHLTNCRRKYEEQMKEEKREMDIGICRFDAFHHIPLNEMKQHETKCSKRHKLYEYLDYFLERRRASKEVNFTNVAKK